ncbi:heme o synthase [Marinobacterium litorale]|uniref:heme o synthase n=1 Tax=Marinobacterium litorale TaxID=404770 RepID=UPI0004241E38|nr:heme o synthase [Marinobacterium litorale]
MATYPLAETVQKHHSSWRDYLALCKLKVVVVMLLTLVVGMCLASPAPPSFSLLVLTNLGVGLAAAGAAAINHVLDREIDARMARTARRPLPQGRVSTLSAVIFATLLGVSGILVLAVSVNVLTALLTLFSLVGYAFIYTAFLKRATPQNIVIGGVAGAAPPLLGWTAVTGSVAPEGLLLMLIIFAWTPPHFWALCLARRVDYERSGIPMLPITHGDAYTRLQIVLYTLLTILTTALPYFSELSGLAYLIGVSLLNVRFLQWSWRVYRSSDSANAMKMFKFSILYIMSLFAILLVDHYWKIQL